MKNGNIYRFASDKPIGIGKGFKVKIYLAKNIKIRKDSTITACAATITAIPISMNGINLLHTLKEKELIIPVQEDGCEFNNAI